jgi:hypothetical protein
MEICIVWRQLNYVKTMFSTRTCNLICSNNSERYSSWYIASESCMIGFCVSRRYLIQHNGLRGWGMHPRVSETMRPFWKLQDLMRHPSKENVKKEASAITIIFLPLCSRTALSQACAKRDFENICWWAVLVKTEPRSSLAIIEQAIERF